jgi:tocopherol cyclase
MNNFHGQHRNHSYFEGWYFKHQSTSNAVAFIPGVNFNEQGEKNAFIQVITRDTSFQINYPYSSFRVCRHRPALRIGDNVFSDKGVRINIRDSNINCHGTIKYASLSPLKSDIMGPFRFIPFMECNHGVISMKHSLTGSLTLNGEEIDLDGGHGYIEKDWGTSFPASYLWVQCNRFTEPSCSIMVSIAKIPFAGFHFQGCIGVINFKGKEYRLATYNGVKLIRYSEKGFIIKQGEYVLEVEILSKSPQQLLAPQLGVMTRMIRENTSCRAHFRFYRRNALVLDLQSDEAGYEYVK